MFDNIIQTLSEIYFAFKLAETEKKNVHYRQVWRELILYELTYIYSIYKCGYKLDIATMHNLWSRLHWVSFISMGWSFHVYLMHDA